MRSGRIIASAVALVLVAAVATIAFRPLRERWSGTLPPPPREAPAGIGRDQFVGSDRCAGCHAGQYAAWRASAHGRAGGPPAVFTIAPFDESPIEFANARVTPRVRAGRHEFVVIQPNTADVVLTVAGVVGGGHIYGGGTQGFVTHAVDGTWRFLPFEWSRQRRAWFCNTNSRSGKGWTPITRALRLEECGDWPPIRVLGDHPRYANCQSCHASQATVALDTVARRYTTRLASLAINCESCHGPAGRHVALADRDALGASADVGFEPLAAMNKEASVGLCAQCHAVKDQLRPGFLSGAVLARFYSTKLPLLGDRPLHPDGRIRTFAYQEGHYYSDCYLNGGMTCVSCHDPHTQGYRDVNGAALPGRFDDRQCLGCHTSKAETPIVHTQHEDPRVTCTSCHMPLRQEPETRALDPRHAGAPVVPYARSDHSISIPRPRVDSTLGLVSACAMCHPGTSTAVLEVAIAERWGRIKPLPPVIAGQLADAREADSAVVRLLGRAGDGGDANPYARFAGLARFIDEFVRADRELPSGADERLRALARSADVDVRAAALAALHLARGSRRSTRRVLAAALRSDEASDSTGTDGTGLRARWATILGFAGDRDAAAGNIAPAIIAYRRGLEVEPERARLWINLGSAQRAAGDLAGAVASFRRAVAVDEYAPLAWVNLGIALTDLGDRRGAEEALTRATTVDAGEPLAWFNLGNLELLRGDLPRAEAYYARAAALDGSIALVHFQRARVALLRADSAAALHHVRRGLALDSSDVSAREVEQLLDRRRR